MAAILSRPQCVNNVCVPSYVPTKQVWTYNWIAFGVWICCIVLLFRGEYTEKHEKINDQNTVTMS